MRYEHKDMVRTRVTLQQSTSAVTFTVTLYIYECLLLTSISKVSFPYTSYSTLFDPIPPYLFIPYTLQSTLYTLRLYIPTFLHSPTPLPPHTHTLHPYTPPLHPYTPTHLSYTYTLVTRGFLKRRSPRGLSSGIVFLSHLRVNLTQ